MRTTRATTWVLSGAMLVAASCGQPAGGREPVEPPPVETGEEEAAPEMPAVEIEEPAAGEPASEPAGEEEEDRSAPVEPDEVDRGPETVLLAEKAKLGNVDFGHSTHQAHNDCTDCHHEGEAGAQPAACRSCHGVDESAPAAKQAFHSTCQGCHKKGTGGPVKCVGCHGK